MATRPFEPPRRSWISKFSCAIRGVVIAMRGQSSFAVHVSAAALVVIAGVLLRPGAVAWSLLVLCITIVLATEVMNSALERLAKAVDSSYNQYLADGLDMAGGAVLIVSLGAAVVGSIVLLRELGRVLSWF